MKKHRTLIFFLSAILLTSTLVFLLLLMPDMSSTVIKSVPEYPPRPTPVISADSESLDKIAVDRTNIKNIVSAIARPKEYFSETKSTLYHADGSAEYMRKKWVKGELSRVDIISSVTTQSVSAHYIYSPDSVYIWEPDDRTYYRTARGEFEADDAQMLMSYEDITKVPDEWITAAQHTVYDGSLCIYGEVKNPSSSYTERYWISSSTGLLLHGETLDENGTVVYTVSSTQTDISMQDESIFTLPDGTILTK